MMFRTLGAVAALLLAAQPALAQATPTLAAAPETLRAAVAAYVQPTNEARTRVVVEQLRAAGFEPVVETFEGGGRQTGPMEGRNVVAVFGPEGAREILITAHYDAVKLRDGSLAHGVVDNAASVVGVIEAARLLKDKALNHRVRVILFDQEELGLVGARKWIEAHGIANVAAVVNSDVAAYGDTLMYGQNIGEASAFVTRAVREVCAERAMDCVGFPIYPPSDDRAFTAAGAPVVSLGFQDHVGAHQMWLAFNGGEDNGLAEGFTPQVFRIIHSDEDTMDAVDPATVARAAETYAALIEKLDYEIAAR